MRAGSTFTHADAAAVWRIVAAKRRARGDTAGAAVAARNAGAQKASHQVGVYHDDNPASGMFPCC